tara:strand:+ start:1301 stop:2089 length:789 start_codon:yes stop_codon:yes gene_type:complete
MSNRTVIWVRDALVIIFSFYVVFAVASVPWANLKVSHPLPETCETGCAPVVSFPENGYYHYQNSVAFEWSSVSVGYRVVVTEVDTGDVKMDKNVTNEVTSTTSRLPAGDYLTRVYYTGITGSTFSTYPILKSELVNIETSSKIIVFWSEVTVTYGLEIRVIKEAESELPEIVKVHEVSKLEESTYTYSDFEHGKSYSWSVYAQDSKGYTSESSPFHVVNIDTTKFLAFELFNNWEVPFILLGVMMVIAMQAGVFLAREELND